MKATFIKKLTKNFRGDVRLYKLDPPIDGSEFVAVSGIHCALDTGRPETFMLRQFTAALELVGSSGITHTRPPFGFTTVMLGNV